MSTRIDATLALQRRAYETFEIFKWIELCLSWKSQTMSSIEIINRRALDPLYIAKTRKSCSRNLLLENFL